MRIEIVEPTDEERQPHKAGPSPSIVKSLIPESSRLQEQGDWITAIGGQP